MEEKTIPMDDNLLMPGERLDDLELSGLRIIQDPSRFCFGMDAVLLSGFVQNNIGVTKKTGKVLDMGTGTGIIPLLLSAKIKADQICGLEIQADSADMAHRSVQINGLENKIEIINGDIKEAASFFDAASLDIITCNPPYMIAEHGIENPMSAKAIARHEICCTLDDVCAAAGKLLRPGGQFYMVHRPFRLAEIIRTLSLYKLEPKKMRMVYPYIDKEPNMVLIQAVKGGKPRMEVDKPLIVYDEPGKYSSEMCRDYGY